MCGRFGSKLKARSSWLQHMCVCVCLCLHLYRCSNLRFVCVCLLLCVDVGVRVSGGPLVCQATPGPDSLSEDLRPGKWSTLCSRRKPPDTQTYLVPRCTCQRPVTSLPKFWRVACMTNCHMCFVNISLICVVGSYRKEDQATRRQQHAIDSTIQSRLDFCPWHTTKAKLPYLTCLELVDSFWHVASKVALFHFASSRFVYTSATLGLISFG